MAFVRDISQILEKMRIEKTPFYIVKDGSDPKKVIDQNDDAELGLDQAIDRLNSTLGNIDGTVHVEISGRSRKDKAGGGNLKNFHFSIRLGNSISGTNQGSAGIPQGNLFELLMMQMKQTHELQMQLMLQKFEAEREKDRLIRSIGDTENDTKTMLLKKALEKVDIMFPNKTPQNQPAIHGHPQQQQQLKKIEMSKEQQDKLNLAIHKLLEKDPEFIEHIGILANLAEKDPEIYQIAIKKLKNLS